MYKIKYYVPIRAYFIPYSKLSDSPSIFVIGNSIGVFQLFIIYCILFLLNFDMEYK